MTPLFDSDSPPSREPLEEGAVLLRGFATGEADLLAEVHRVAQAAPFRHLITPGGYTMSVAMTNCGRVGWVSDRPATATTPRIRTAVHPGRRMPARSSTWRGVRPPRADLRGYDPDACLINRYSAGAKLGLHQDRDEEDDWAPIVSVSLGLPAVFLWGGKRRGDPVRRLRVENGDVVVWGGPARFIYHGVAPFKGGEHPLTGPPHQFDVPQGLLTARYGRTLRMANGSRRSVRRKTSSAVRLCSASTSPAVCFR